MLYRHLAASEGCYKVTEWLIELGSDVNALDRFKRTPLEVCNPPEYSSGWRRDMNLNELFQTGSLPVEESEWTAPPCAK